MQTTKTSTDFKLELQRMKDDALQLSMMQTLKDEFAILIHKGLLESLEGQKDVATSLAQLLSTKDRKGFSCHLMALCAVIKKCEDPRREHLRVKNTIYVSGISVEDLYRIHEYIMASIPEAPAHNPPPDFRFGFND